ncbi:MAG: YceI family protein [Bacteroidales bacterium]|nr:YceI family protein [Bacteroidales bacterium]
MKKSILVILSLALLCVTAFSQNVYFTKGGNIDFLSKTPVENIEAVNNQVVSFLKTETGDLNFGVLIKSFKFKNALMEEHFNENYMESDKFPKATFKGQITNLDDIDIGNQGIYTANITGNLTIHNVTNEEETTAQIEVKAENIVAISTIIIKPEDYNIEIPDIVKEKIAKIITVNINIVYELYKK